MPSSEEDLLQRANNVDESIRAAEDQSKLGQAMTGADQPANVNSTLGSDPPATPQVVALKETMTIVVRTAVARLHDKWEWSDPGDEWKRGVATLLGLLGEKYLGAMATQQSTEVALLLMVGSWVVENVIAKGVPTFGKKLDEKTAEAASETTAENPRSARGDGIREEYLSPEAA